jgi:hypothetical protein
MTSSLRQIRLCQPSPLTYYYNIYNIQATSHRQGPHVHQPSAIFTDKELNDVLNYFGAIAGTRIAVTIAALLATALLAGLSYLVNACTERCR